MTPGFTDYYAGILLMRSGHLELADLIEIRNKQIVEYETSPARTADNEAIENHYWEDSTIQRLPYLRGVLLAMRWDVEIQEATQGEASLDDVIRKLMARADEERFDQELLLTMMGPLWPSVATELATYVDRGEPIAPHPRGMGPCVHLEMTKKAIYDLGFDVDRSIETNRLHGVDPEGAAHRVDRRDGQKIVAIDAPGSPDGLAHDEISVEVRDDGGEVVEVQYLPTPGPREVPTYILDEAQFTDDPHRCMSWFGVRK